MKFTKKKDTALLLDFENRLYGRIDYFIQIEEEQTKNLKSNLKNAQSHNERIGIFNQYLYDKMCQQNRISEIWNTVRSIERILGRLQIHGERCEGEGN